MKKYDGHISLKEFTTLSVSIDITKQVKDETEYVLKEILKSDDTEIYMPAVYPRYEGHPLDLYLTLGMRTDPDDNPVFVSNLAGILNPKIKQTAKDGSYAEELGRIVMALRQLATKIEAAIRQGNR